MNFLTRVFILYLPMLSSLQASTWSDAVEKELAKWKDSENAPLAPIYRRAFLEDLPHRVVQFGTDPKKPTKEIYIGDGTAGVKSSPGDWNVIANGTNVYAWREGETTGIVTPQNDTELFRYLEGTINPLMMMGVFYAGYLHDPKVFRTEEKGNVLEFASLDPKVGIFTNWSFLLQKEPAWLLGFKIKDPKSGSTSELRISPPERVSQIPSSFCTPPKEVKFSPGIISWSKDLIPYL